MILTLVQLTLVQLAACPSLVFAGDLRSAAASLLPFMALQHQVLGDRQSASLCNTWSCSASPAPAKFCLLFDAGHLNPHPHPH
jgi:hypothetical protein